MINHDLKSYDENEKLMKELSNLNPRSQLGRRREKMLNKELIVFVKDISEENKLFIEDHKLSINMVNLYSKKRFF